MCYVSGNAKYLHYSIEFLWNRCCSLILLDEETKAQSSGRDSGRARIWTGLPLTPWPRLLAILFLCVCVCVFVFFVCLPNTSWLNHYLLTKWGLSFLLAFSCSHVIFTAARCADANLYFWVWDQAGLRWNNNLFDQKTGFIQVASTTRHWLHQGQWFLIFYLGIGFYVKLS